MNRSLRVVISVLIGVALAAMIAWAQTRAPSSGGGITGIAGTPIGGDFAGLVDQNGNPVSADTFDGKIQLVFFGFTHCPAICPTELTRMTYVLKNLDAADREKLAAIFVTVDPERDTPKALKTYLTLFHPDIVALTGAPEALKQVRSDWKVYAARVDDPDLSEYTMDHTAFLYMRGGDGRLLGLFSPEEGPKPVLEGVKAALAAQKHDAKPGNNAESSAR